MLSLQLIHPSNFTPLESLKISFFVFVVFYLFCLSIRIIMLLWYNKRGCNGEDGIFSLRVRVCVRVYVCM